MRIIIHWFFQTEKCIITIPKLVFGYTASHVFQHSVGSLLVFLSWNSTRYALLEGIRDSPTHPTAVFSLNYFIQIVFLMWWIWSDIMDFHRSKLLQWSYLHYSLPEYFWFYAIVYAKRWYLSLRRLFGNWSGYPWIGIALFIIGYFSIGCLW